MSTNITVHDVSSVTVGKLSAPQNGMAHRTIEIRHTDGRVTTISCHGIYSPGQILDVTLPHDDVDSPSPPDDVHCPVCQSPICDMCGTAINGSFQAQSGRYYHHRCYDEYLEEYANYVGNLPI